MKNLLKFIFILICAITCVGCDNINSTSQEEPNWAVEHEKVSGVVKNESGELLEGIQIKACYDKDLTQLYPDMWGTIIYTNEEGCYKIGKVAHYDYDTLNLYIVATDTTGRYEQQIKSGQIVYVCTGMSNGVKNYRPINPTVNFILKKK